MKSLILLVGVCAALALAKPQVYDVSTLSEASDRIVNGHNSSRGQFPHQVLIYISLGENRTARCGGSLLCDQWIITAAHCTHGGVAFEVHLGAHRLGDINEEGRVIRTSADSFVHPNYFPALLLNDVALLRLHERVTFSDLIRPIRLARRGNYYHDLVAIGSGFGVVNSANRDAPSILQWAQFNTVNNLECARLFGNYVGALVLRPSVICGVGVRQASGCFGDSGGPLITEDGFLIGVAGFVSNHGCDAGYPTAFARVGFFLDWISEVTGVPL